MFDYPAAYTHQIHLTRLSPLIDARKYATSRINQNKIVFHFNPLVRIAEVPFFGGVACLATPGSGNEYRQDEEQEADDEDACSQKIPIWLCFQGVPMKGPWLSLWPCSQEVAMRGLRLSLWPCFQGVSMKGPWLCLWPCFQEVPPRAMF